MTYRLGQLLARGLWPLFGSLEVRGSANVPVAGPFLLISNHQSVLDPILIQAIVRRPIFAMAKSTQFNARVLGALMPHILTFPVRRYQVDPQAVRTALRLLQRGNGVAIYIEGERSWNGRLQELRRGTVRLLLRAGVPVVPTVIAGSYNAWPRWAARPSRANVTIEFLEPITRPALRGSANRAAVSETTSQIAAILSAGLARLTEETGHGAA
jgi:1-acyl-sn-glycerol-3-phosphate acyltransferase